MTGRIFLHIGPPKTATTSLQVALETLEHPDYVYGGTLQPRDRNAGSLANDLHLALLEDAHAGARAVEALGKLLAAGKTVMISEEMLSLEQRGITTAAKIGRLGVLLKGLPTTVLITLRQPAEALPSLYQELYRGLPRDMQRDFPLFCSSGRAACFEYERLEVQLASAGLREPRWIDFDDISHGRLTTQNVFGEHDLWNGHYLPVAKLNVGAKVLRGQRRLPVATLRAIGRNQLVSSAIDGLGLRGGRLVKFTADLLGRVPLRKDHIRTLLVPEDRAAELAQGYEALRSKSSSLD